MLEPDGDERWKLVKQAVADDPKARSRINAYLFDLERALEEVKDCLQYTERMVRTPTPTGPRTETGPDGYAKLLNSCQDSVDTIRNLEKQICSETGLPSLDPAEVQLIHCKFLFLFFSTYLTATFLCVVNLYNMQDNTKNQFCF